LPSVPYFLSRLIIVRTLYLCYFGLREPLTQTQVLPYLRELVRGGLGVHLLTFEPGGNRAWDESEREGWRARLESQGIQWRSLDYHKRPSLPATLYDIASGALTAARQVRRERIDVMHARSYVPAAMGAVAKWLAGGKLIFDIRGFMAEEYVDAGIWPEGGLLYRWTKTAEKKLLKAADGFVVLTEKARKILFPRGGDGRPVEVIPCCVDAERFRAFDEESRDDLRRMLNLKGRRVIIYVGSLGGWYLTDEMAELMALAHHEDASTFLMVLTQSPPEMIVRRLNALGVSQSDYLVKKVAPEEAPRYLKAADFAVSLIKPCYSKMSSSPTKIAEYLASGLPVISSAGIGDLDDVIAEDNVGVILNAYNRESYGRALEGIKGLLLDRGIAERCRESARRRFDLANVGGVRYSRLYRRVLEGGRLAGGSNGTGGNYLG
jgi:glycosyltransferase involved in cell wall biosynthesis